MDYDGGSSVKVLLGYRHYPMSIGLMMKRAFKRLGIEFVSVGPYSGDEMPWPGRPRFPGMEDKPDVVLPERTRSYPTKLLPDLFGPSRVVMLPDAVFSFDAGFRLTGTTNGAPTALYGTDPHVLDYADWSNEYDYLFSAQNRLLSGPLPKGARWIPLGYDPQLHHREEYQRTYDVCFVGIMGSAAQQSPYHERWQDLRVLGQEFNIIAREGIIGYSCTKLYNDAKIAFNHSSSWDIPMRLWEGAAYGCCVITNRLPDLELAGFVDGKTCLVYDTREELVEKVRWALADDNWKKIAKVGHERLAHYTYDNRVLRMLRIMGLR